MNDVNANEFALYDLCGSTAKIIFDDYVAAYDSEDEMTIRLTGKLLGEHTAKVELTSNENTQHKVLAYSGLDNDEIDALLDAKTDPSNHMMIYPSLISNFQLTVLIWLSKDKIIKLKNFIFDNFEMFRVGMNLKTFPHMKGENFIYGKTSNPKGFIENIYFSSDWSFFQQRSKAVINGT